MTRARIVQEFPKWNGIEEMNWPARLLGMNVIDPFISELLNTTLKRSHI